METQPCAYIMMYITMLIDGEYCYQQQSRVCHRHGIVDGYIYSSQLTEMPGTPLCKSNGTFSYGMDINKFI